MSEPIPIRVTRHRCPHCTRSYSAKHRARDHIARCWHNPDNRGCKTCCHFRPAEPAEFDTGYPGVDEECAEGVGLLGDSGTQSGPIVGCDLWASADRSGGEQR